MGYTHYWKVERDFTAYEWKEMMYAAEIAIEKEGNGEIVEEHDVDLPPFVSMANIVFNGRGESGDETFVLERLKGSFSCCKTARKKPYDTIVVAILAWADERFDFFHFTSDGDDHDLKEGYALAAFCRIKTGRKERETQRSSVKEARKAELESYGNDWGAFG